jgi:DNA-binding response OmpR family regulator
MPKKIPLVDDEPKTIEIYQAYLRAGGFEVITAGDGPKGLFTACLEKPDLVILDLMPPGMEGLDVCRELRRDGNIPVIMLTTRAEEKDRLLRLALGADDYIAKPFSPRELVARVHAILRRVDNDPRPRYYPRR